MTRTAILTALLPFAALAGCAGVRAPLPPPASASSCLVVDRPDGLTDAVVLRDCRVRPRARLAREWIVGPTQCNLRLGSVRTTGQVDAPFDPRYWLESGIEGDRTQEIEVLPRTRVTDAGATSDGLIACDYDAARFYVGHHLLGYVVAFDAEGRELWRASLPRFRSVVPELTALPNRTGAAILNLLDSKGSVLTKLSTSGPYVAAEYRNADLYFQAIYHRSGVLVGVVGPWNGLFVERRGSGWHSVWTLATEPGAYFFPDHEGSLEVADTSWELLWRHLAASVTPNWSGGEATWDLCAGGAADLEPLLGRSWRSDLAKLAVQARGSLGTSWLEQLASSARSRDRVGFEREMLEAGVDVEMMRAAIKLREAPASP